MCVTVFVETVSVETFQLTRRFILGLSRANFVGESPYIGRLLHHVYHASHDEFLGIDRTAPVVEGAQLNKPVPVAA